ncbi:hypothetical protein [Streptomyces sp. NPDC050528]|uniref:hypothetical protein n=1 Tax=Streptomyces sp. NPDC050528 TaxID=3365623 RepID=UPI0037B98F5F
MSHIEGTPRGGDLEDQVHEDSAPEAAGRNRRPNSLAWAQMVLCALCVAAGAVIGLAGPVALGVAVATAGVLGGGIQVTVHIRR